MSKRETAAARDADRPGDRMRAELRQALRTGPFTSALHLAIEASGLTLEEIQVWLAERGARVSVPTLSYWRRGRSRPERAGSLRAVHLLEELLELPADSLVSLLGPRRSRGGRWLAHPPGTVDVLSLFDEQYPSDLVAKVAEPGPGSLSRISTHVVITIGDDRSTSSIRIREVVRANVPGISRCAVLYLADEQPGNPPALADVRYCRKGRVQVDRSVGLVAAELIFDRVLGAGEPALLEFEWRFEPGMRMLNYDHRFHEPIREYVLQTRFSPDALPARCHRYDKSTPSQAECNLRELWVGGSHTALLAESDLTAGIVGMRWSWPSTDVVG
ncbi:hypothetical protein [Amycolatopsis nigrescens]|uniref:hypothetical protein n=1 Tax=Amycolatopsis nigrescens TaxID=381445 RepID=UPI00036BDF62|nr:hypothetical protein [Amycolatopsis nigrescens]